MILLPLDFFLIFPEPPATKVVYFEILLLQHHPCFNLIFRKSYSLLFRQYKVSDWKNKVVVVVVVGIAKIGSRM